MFIQTISRASGRRGFALIELAVVVLVLVLAFVVASLLVPDARRRARLAGSIQNLQQLGKAAASFAADNDNRVYSLSWAPGTHRCGDYTFPPASNYNTAAGYQAICILRERAGGTDITAFVDWVPYMWFNHLVLIDYLDGALPSPMLVSPGDAPRLAWARSLADDGDTPGSAYFRLACRPAGTGIAEKRRPYTSSYEMQPSFFSPDAIRFLPGGASIPTVAQSPMGHSWFTTGNSMTILGNRRMDEVAFPSHKAFLYETVDRFHGSREAFLMYPEARLPVLAADGSAATRSIDATNRGFMPNSPVHMNATRVFYLPELSWEAPTLRGETSELVEGHIRWTRSGLRGRDFMGPEVPWTP